MARKPKYNLYFTEESVWLDGIDDAYFSEKQSIEENRRRKESDKQKQHKKHSSHKSTRRKVFIDEVEMYTER
jgi:hypothetical protein